MSTGTKRRKVKKTLIRNNVYCKNNADMDKMSINKKRWLEKWQIENPTWNIYNFKKSEVSFSSKFLF